MAFSQSIRRAQVPKTCELCETDTKIKWKCVQCNTLMCDKCKKIHLKVQTSITHDIVDVKSSEANLDMERILTDNIPCQIHKRKLNCMFCKTCNNLVCPECITASHNKHELDSIDTECNGQREKLKELESIFSEQITLCEIEDSKIKDFKAKYEQFSAESLQKTNQQEQLIKDEVSKYALALRKQLKIERQRIEKSIIEKEKHTAEVKETLLNKQRNIQEVLESKQATQVFSAYSEFNEKEISNVSFMGFPEETKKFTPTNDSKKIISNLFGSLHMTKLPIKGLPHMCVDVIKSYTTDLNMVERILIQDDKTAWLSNTAGTQQPRNQPPPPQQFAQPPPQQEADRFSSRGMVCRAVYDYVAADDDEVSFNEGDHIIFCQQIDVGWMEGSVEATGRRGLLPSNYVKTVKK